MKWETQQEEAFKGTKAALCQDVVLQTPDFMQAFTLQTDASVGAIEAVLSQAVERKERPVTYTSSNLNEDE